MPCGQFLTWSCCVYVTTNRCRTSEWSASFPALVGLTKALVDCLTFLTTHLDVVRSLEWSEVIRQRFGMGELPFSSRFALRSGVDSCIPTLERSVYCTFCALPVCPAHMSPVAHFPNL